MREADIQRAIRLAVGRLPDVVLWPNPVGTAVHVHRGRTYTTRYGLAKGSADLIGILAPTGRMLALEVKRPGGKPTKEQVLFLELVRSKSGFAAVVHSVEEALQAVKRAREGQDL